MRSTIDVEPFLINNQSVLPKARSGLFATKKGGSGMITATATIRKALPDLYGRVMPGVYFRPHETRFDAEWVKDSSGRIIAAKATAIEALAVEGIKLDGRVYWTFCADAPWTKEGVAASLACQKNGKSLSAIEVTFKAPHDKCEKKKLVGIRGFVCHVAAYFEAKRWDINLYQIGEQLSYCEVKIREDLFSWQFPDILLLAIGLGKRSDITKDKIVRLILSDLEKNHSLDKDLAKREALLPLAQAMAVTFMRAHGLVAELT
jgi:hypothetical protein